MNSVGAQQRRRPQALSENRACPDSTRAGATDEELEAAILAVLSEAGGGFISWAELREKLRGATL